jgi:hypothetical protein
MTNSEYLRQATAVIERCSAILREDNARCDQCPNKPEYLFGLCYSCYREKGRYIACDHEVAQ